MNLTHLRYLKAAIEAGSLTHAARLLGVRQPTLSEAIQTLERELHTTLLHRDPRGIRPTQAGQALHARAREIFASLEIATQEIHELQGGEVGRFVVGCHESLGAYFLPRFLATFLPQNERLEISLWNRNSEEVRLGVLEREVHFGLAVNPKPHPELVLVDLFGDAVQVCASADRLRDASQDDLARLLHEGPIIYAGRVEQCQQILAALTEQGFRMERRLSCGDLELVKSLTLGGVGVGVLPRRVALYEQEGRLRRLPNTPSIPDRIALLYRADLHRTRAAMRLKDALTAFGRSLDHGSEPTP